MHIAFYLRDQGFLVPCGTCALCRKKHSSEWALRMMHHSETLIDKNALSFITLTYDAEHLPENYSLDPRHLQLFFKRFRKNNPQYKFQYYACGEYGEKFSRPHYHAILFGFPPDVCKKVLPQSWILGLTHVSSKVAKREALAYVAAYVQKKYTGKINQEIYGDRHPPFQRSSQGLGKAWALENSSRLYDNLYVIDGEYKKPIPRQYRKWLLLTQSDFQEQIKKNNEDLEKQFDTIGVTLYNQDSLTPRQKEAYKNEGMQLNGRTVSVQAVRALHRINNQREKNLLARAQQKPRKDV